MSLTVEFARLKIEKIDPEILLDLVPRLQVQQRRGLRPHGVVRDERTRSEVSQAKAAKHPMEVVDARAA